MARSTYRFDSSDAAYGERIAERQRFEQRLKARQWITIAILVWLAAQTFAAGLLCAGFDLLNEPDRPGWLGSGLSFAPVATMLRIAICLTAVVAFAAAAVAAIVTGWNHHLLSAGWLFAGMLPWLLLVVESALFVLWLWD